MVQMNLPPPRVDLIWRYKNGRNDHAVWMHGRVLVDFPFQWKTLPSGIGRGIGRKNNNAFLLIEIMAAEATTTYRLDFGHQVATVLSVWECG